MKKIKILLMLLLCSQAFAQDVIQTKSGTTVNAVEGSIRVDVRNKRLLYKLPNIDKRKKIKIKEVVSASYKDHQFQTFDVDGKRRGFFILANDNGKRLGAISSRRSVSKGGFEVPYNRYELAVIDSAGKVIEYLSFTDVNNSNNIAIRQTAGTIVRSNFRDCPNVLERLRTFENTESKVQNGAIAELIDKPYSIHCQ